MTDPESDGESVALMVDIHGCWESKRRAEIGPCGGVLTGSRSSIAHNAGSMWRDASQGGFPNARMPRSQPTGDQTNRAIHSGENVARWIPREELAETKKGAAPKGAAPRIGLDERNES